MNLLMDSPSTNQKIHPKSTQNQRASHPKSARFAVAQIWGIVRPPLGASLAGLGAQLGPQGPVWGPNLAPKTTAESFWGSTWPPRRPPSSIFSRFGSILGLNLDPKTVPNPAKIDAKTRSLWHLLFGSIFGRFSVPTSTPWNPKSIDFPLVFQ